jgi:hypothetical protein
MKKVLFTAGLSNGETVAEGKGNFEEIEGALSPWRRLVAYLEESKATITSLSLYTADGQRWHLPSAGKNPKFKEFADMPKPVSFRFFRKYGADTMGPNAGVEDRYTVIEATYGKLVPCPDAPTFKVQVWVDENTLKSWSAVTYGNPQP